MSKINLSENYIGSKDKIEEIFHPVGKFNLKKKNFQSFEPFHASCYYLWVFPKEQQNHLGPKRVKKLYQQICNFIVHANRKNFLELVRNDIFSVHHAIKRRFKRSLLHNYRIFPSLIKNIQTNDNLGLTGHNLLTLKDTNNPPTYPKLDFSVVTESFRTLFG